MDRALLRLLLLLLLLPAAGCASGAETDAPHRPHTRTLRQLTSTPGAEGMPRPSPDGRSVAFDAVVDGVSRIFVVSLGDGSVVPLTDGTSSDARPTWSPVGDRMAFVSTMAGGRRGIWTMRPDGTDRREVFDAGGTSVSAADWSPDGRRLGFSRLDRSRPGNVGYGRGTIVTLDLEDGTVTELTTGGDEWWPRWSADGEWLYYYVGRSDDLEKVHYLTREIRPAREAPLVGWSPAASPDGGTLAFVGDIAGLGLFLAPLDSDAAPVALVSDGEPDSPAFLPDGSGLVLTLDTTTTFVVTRDLARASADTIASGWEPEWLPGGGLAWFPDGPRGHAIARRRGGIVDTLAVPLEYLNDFTFSPDGTRLVVTAPGERNARHDVHLLDAGGTYLARLTDSGDVYEALVWCDDHTVVLSSRGGRRINAYRRLQRLDVDAGTLRPAGPEPVASQRPTDCDQRGRRVTYERRLNESGLFSVDPDDPSAPVRISGTAWGGRWSPDGRRLVYLDRDGGRTDVFIQEPDGRRTRITNDDAVESSPSWSPDGGAITYAVRSPNRGIWLLEGELPRSGGR